MAMDEGIKSRASSLLTQLDCLPPHKLAPSARSRLSKLLRSEIRFLHGLSDHTASALNSTNLGYLEAVLQVVRHPCVDAVSAVLQTYTVSSSLNKAAKANKDHEKLAEVHVDIVCTFQAKPVWIIVSDRNPKYSYWSDACSFVKGWQSRVQLLVNVAQSFSVLQPAAVFFCFARGVLSSLVTGFEAEVGASRIELFGENEVIRSNAIETLGTGFGEMSFETDDEDWVCIQVSRKQVDLDVPSQDLQHRVTSTTADVTCKDWVTFQVDINASLDGFEVLDCRGPGLRKIHKQAPSENLLPHRVMGTVFKSNGQENLDAVTSCQLQHVGKLDPSHDGFHYVFGDCNGSFLSFLSTLWPRESLLGKIENSVSTSNLVNLDTTALIALVSEVSNGAASMLVNMCNKDLVSKFGNTGQFMKDQAEEELKSPLLEEIANLLAHRRPFISESVCREFKSLVSLCGGFEEKTRAEELLNFLPVVPDAPSARVMNLCETGKIKEKNKVVFGTGDCWQAPTLTANLSFVRAVRQTGMALSVLEHKPRALVGEKCR